MLDVSFSCRCPALGPMETGSLLDVNPATKPCPGEALPRGRHLLRLAGRTTVSTRSVAMPSRGFRSVALSPLPAQLAPELLSHNPRNGTLHKLEIRGRNWAGPVLHCPHQWVLTSGHTQIV